MPLTGFPRSASLVQAHASEDGLFLGDTDLEKIVALLLWMSQDYQSTIHKNDIHAEALGAIIKCADSPTGSALGMLTSNSIAQLAKLIDIMMLHKDGSPKEANTTLQFMKRVAKVRKELLEAASDNATERVELNQEAVSKCYQRLGCNLITHDLLPHQKKNKKYHLRNKFEGDTHLSTPQRSFVDSMLRKFLGDKRIAILIWQHGLPSIIDPPAFKALDMRMLQSSLNECLGWYASLANEIAAHRTQEGFDDQLSASSLDKEERQRQQKRREAVQKTRDALRLGATLAQQRDNNKRSYDDMDTTEQQMLEEYDTGRTKIAKQSITPHRMKAFRCKLQSN